MVAGRRQIVYGVEQDAQIPVPLDVDLRVLDLATPDTRRLARPQSGSARRRGRRPATASR
jgi:hypothetical protein